MAFRYHRLGITLAARSDKEHIIVETPVGEAKYKVPFGVEIPLQANDFISNLIVFYLEHDGICYVGRRDGTFSGYRVGDNLLVRTGRWEPPEERTLSAVGVYFDEYRIRRGAYIDDTDRRTIYVAQKNKIYVFNKAHKEEFVTVQRYAPYYYKLYLYTQEGEIDTDEEGRWFVSSVQERRDVGMCI
jgi:hypothetical protein